MMPKRLIDPDDEGRMIVGIMLICLMLVVVLVGVLIHIPRSLGAEIALPREITRGSSFDDTQSLNRFGTYSTRYLERRWARMCKGPARYDAMREAYELGHGMPCK